MVSSVFIVLKDLDDQDLKDHFEIRFKEILVFEVVSKRNSMLKPYFETRTIFSLSRSPRGRQALLQHHFAEDQKVCHSRLRDTLGAILGRQLLLVGFGYEKKPSLSNLGPEAYSEVGTYRRRFSSFQRAGHY